MSASGSSSKAAAVAATSSTSTDVPDLKSKVVALEKKVATLELHLRAAAALTIGIGLALLVAQIRSGPVQAIVAVGVLTAGWAYLTFTKEPVVQAIQIARLKQARKTKALEIFRQNLGIAQFPQQFPQQSQSSSQQLQPPAATSAGVAGKQANEENDAALSSPSHAPLSRREIVDTLSSGDTTADPAATPSAGSSPQSPALKPKPTPSVSNNSPTASTPRSPQAAAERTPSIIAGGISSKSIYGGNHPQRQPRAQKVESRLKQGALLTRQGLLQWTKRYGVLVSVTQSIEGKKKSKKGPAVFELRIGKDAMEAGSEVAMRLTTESEVRKGKPGQHFNKRAVYEFVLKTPGSHVDTIHCATELESSRDQWIQQLQRCITSLRVSKQVVIDKENRARVRDIVLFVDACKK